MRPALRSCMLAVVVLLLAGCVSVLNRPGSVRGSATLDDAVYQSLACRPHRDEPGAFVLRDQRPLQQGVLALYTAQCPDHDRPIPMIGYAVVESQRTGWVVIASSYSGVRTPIIEADAAMTGNGEIAGRAIKYGRILNPAIARVEVVFEDGQVQRDQPRNDMFVLELRHATRACELRFVDARGQVIQRHSLQAVEPCS